MCDVKKYLHNEKYTRKCFIAFRFCSLKSIFKFSFIFQKKYIYKLNNYISAYHLSENNSKSDDNLQFKKMLGFGDI